MTSTIYSVLAGRDLPVTPRKPQPLHKETPRAIPQKSEIREVLDIMHGKLDYLKAEPSERAKLEAAPLIEQERARSARLEAETKAASEAALKAAQARYAEDTTKLRTELLESDTEIHTVRTTARESQSQVEGLRAELEQATKEAAEVASRHQDEIAAVRRASLAPPVPAPALPAAPLKPEDIEFEYRRDLNGLLSGMVLKAPGYTSLVVEVVRGADNRMRHLKARDL